MTNNLASTKRRLSYYLNSKGITITKFFSETGIKRGFLDSDKMDNSVSDENLKKIISVYNDLDPVWLITGDGSMIRTPKTVPFEEADSLDHEVQMLTQRLELQDKTIEDKDNTIELLSNQLEDLRGQFDNQLKAKDAQINSLLAILANNKT